MQEIRNGGRLLGIFGSVEDFEKGLGFFGTKDDFINFSKTNTYNLTEEVAEKLWVIYNEQREKQ